MNLFHHVNSFLVNTCKIEVVFLYLEKYVIVYTFLQILWTVLIYLLRKFGQLVSIDQCAQVLRISKAFAFYIRLAVLMLIFCLIVFDDFYVFNYYLLNLNY